MGLRDQAIGDEPVAGGIDYNAIAMAAAPVKCVDAPPSFLCPITMELMHDPVTAADGSGAATSLQPRVRA